jgi:hypothetical protein
MNQLDRFHPGARVARAELGPGPSASADEDADAVRLAVARKAVDTSPLAALGDRVHPLRGPSVVTQLVTRADRPTKDALGRHRGLELERAMGISHSLFSCRAYSRAGVIGPAAEAGLSGDHQTGADTASGAIQVDSILASAAKTRPTGPDIEKPHARLGWTERGRDARRHGGHAEPNADRRDQDHMRFVSDRHGSPSVVTYRTNT